MSTQTCIEIESELPALALGALDAEERAFVMAHVDICARCREQLAAHMSVADGLMRAVPPRVPPPGLKQALMARVQQHHTQAQSSVWQQLVNWLRRGQAVPHWALGAVTAVLVLALGLFGLQTTRLGMQQEVLVTQLRQQQAALALLSGSGTTAVNMQGTAVAASATAVLKFDPEDTVAILQTRDLPALSANQAYQLWLVDASGKRDSGAVFSVPGDANGKVTLVVMAPRPMKTYVRCGVSIEPQGGSPAPTGPAALSSKLWS
jgi:anti-sigma-K factor RskA